MCKWGDTLPLFVRVPADLSHTGKSRWAIKQIDRCIAALVRKFQHGGIDMRSSCCGHGKDDGEIMLADGRQLVIRRGDA